MGRKRSKRASTETSKDIEKDSWRDQWRATRHRILTSFSHSSPAAPEDLPPDNIFAPIQQDEILPQVPIRRHHPVPLRGIEDDDKRTLHTNAFYANAFLGQQDQPIWTHPYSIWWGRGSQDAGMLPTWGMNISHVEENDTMYGSGDLATSYSYSRKQSVILSALELELASTFLTTDNHLPFSVNINLNRPSNPPEPSIIFPVVQGMAFVTAGYRDATPTIQTGGKGFVKFSGPIKLGHSVKYRMTDMDGQIWLIYVNPAMYSTYDITRFVRLDPNTILGPPGFRGTIQVAKQAPGFDAEAIYDRASASFAQEVKLSAVVNDSKGSYSFHYTKSGSSPLLIFVLPHQLQSLDSDMKTQVTTLRLRTTTKGMATAVWAEKLTFVEPNLPTSMGLGPWSPAMAPSGKMKYPPEVLNFIGSVAERDLRRVMTEPLNPDSVYFAGKILARFATIVWILKEIVNNDTQAATGLDRLKLLIGKYIANQQRWPIYYDDSWKGAVSNIGFSNPGADFGITYYNDHHIHWAYHIYTCAVIGHLDPKWVNQGDNKAWTNMLVKDFAESDYNGRDYPFSRCFDWWHGHSWGKGLFECPDGKDQGSTSEDGFASFAMKMWGRATGDVNMEKRGNLMLAIQARSFNDYFYLQPSTTNYSARLLQDRIIATMFENKVNSISPSLFTTLSHTSSPPIIINPSTAYLRPRALIKHEWNTLLSPAKSPLHNIDQVEGAWRGILYAQYALVDAKASYAFFRDGHDGYWDDAWIDPAASRAWYLVWCAGLVEGRGR